MLNVLSRSQLTNYRILLGSAAVASIAMGVWMPLMVLFIQDFGFSREIFVFAVASQVAAYSLTALFAGHFSDRFGRKPFMIGANLATAGIVVAYTFITSMSQLYTLQILLGIVNAMGATPESAFWGDVTEKKTRGRAVGGRDAFLGLVAAAAMVIAAKLTGAVNLDPVFYVVAGFFVLSAIVLLFIREQR